MTHVTDQSQLCFCFALHSQHNWHLCWQLATYALSCVCILISKSIWRGRCWRPCNLTKTIEEHLLYLIPSKLYVMSAKLLPCSNAWASEGFFPGEGTISGFSTGNHKKFSRGRPKVMIFHFSFWKLRKQPFFAKNVIEKCQFQNPGARLPCPPLPTPMILGEFTVLHDCYGCTWHRVVASVGAMVHGPPFKICGPHFVFAPPVAAYIQYCI